MYMMESSEKKPWEPYSRLVKNKFKYLLIVICYIIYAIFISVAGFKGQILSLLIIV